MRLDDDFENFSTIVPMSMVTGRYGCPWNSVFYTNAPMYANPIICGLNLPSGIHMRARYICPAILSPLFFLILRIGRTGTFQFSPRVIKITSSFFIVCLNAIEILRIPDLDSNHFSLTQAPVRRDFSFFSPNRTPMPTPTRFA